MVRLRQALVAVALCACAIVAVLGWAAGSGRLGVAARGQVLLVSEDVDSSMVHALQTALREDGKVQQLQGEMKTLDKIRYGMMQQLAHQPTTHLVGGDRIKQLGEMVQDTAQLQARLDAAAQAEKTLLVQSEEVVDGGCKDHHAEICGGGESCCTFWAKAGQCLSTSAHQAWMSVRCSASCGSCTSVPAAAATAQAGVEKNAARAAKKFALKKKVAAHKSGLSWPAPGGKKTVWVSMVLHGLDTSKLSHTELEKALHRAVFALTPDGLSMQDVKLDSVAPVKASKATLLHADKPIRRRGWAHPKRSKVVAYVHGTMPERSPDEGIAPTFRSSRNREEEDRGESFAPRRRLLSTEPDLASTGNNAVRVKFHVQVPVGLKGERMVDALRAAVREEVHKELVRSKLAHPQSLHVALEHVQPKQVLDTVHSLFGSMLGKRSFHQEHDAAVPHRPAEESGFGAVEQTKSNKFQSNDKFGNLLAGGSAYAHIPGESDSSKLVGLSQAQESFPQWFGHPSVSGNRETGLGQAGLGESGPERHVEQQGPLVGSPYLDGKKTVYNDEEHRRGTLERVGEPRFIQEAPTPATKELPWSFAQKLNDEPREPVPLEGENAADAVGWTYEGVGRAAEPALPSDCGAECVKEKEAKRAAAEKLAAEHREAEDLVAVKKEHVIEDARNLKHLMTAITEEKDLLLGLPAPPPPHVEPHWGVKQDTTAELQQDKSSTSTLSAATPPADGTSGGDSSPAEGKGDAAASSSEAGVRGRLSTRAGMHFRGSRPVEQALAGLRVRDWHRRVSLLGNNRIAGPPRKVRQVHRERVSSLVNNGIAGPPKRIVTRESRGARVRREQEHDGARAHALHNGFRDEHTANAPHMQLHASAEGWESEAVGGQAGASETRGGGGMKKVSGGKVGVRETTHDAWDERVPDGAGQNSQKSASY